MDTGVFFSRTLSNLPSDSSFALNFSQYHCQERDGYGDDHCHYDWGEDVVLEYYVVLPHIQLLWSSARAVGQFLIDGKLPWSFECPLCGQDCVLKVPVVDLTYTYKMPACPIVLPRAKESHTMTFSLWKDSPTHGWISTRLEGTVVVYKNVPRQAILANVSVSIDVV
jgi:hypothetical protein